jgi:hypothetical protein
MRPIFDDKAFIEWIARQNPNAVYTYDSCEDCLIAQYLKHRGIETVCVGRSDVAFFHNFHTTRQRRLPPNWDAVARGKGKTFGKALERAQVLLG